MRRIITVLLISLFFLAVYIGLKSFLYKPKRVSATSVINAMPATVYASLTVPLKLQEWQPEVIEIETDDLNSGFTQGGIYTQHVRAGERIFPISMEIKEMVANEKLSVYLKSGGFESALDYYLASKGAQGQKTALTVSQEIDFYHPLARAAGDFLVQKLESSLKVSLERLIAHYSNAITQPTTPTVNSSEEIDSLSATN